MRNEFIGLLTCLTAMTTLVQAQTPSVSIIPQPVQVNVGTETLTLPRSVVIDDGGLSSLGRSVSFLTEKISFSGGYAVKTLASNAKGGSVKVSSTIRLVINSKVSPVIGSEGYTLQVGAKQIIITANQPAGIFYGVQTLMQLFPTEIESSTPLQTAKWIIPQVSITDYPRFGWRGLMFDVSRHFFTKQDVKQYIDQMVRFKYNLLHLHLTDDEGWRIEIKSLPKLTSVGSLRVGRVGYFGTFKPPLQTDPRNSGGFYTQEDIKELVKYAGERFVNILPEIDVPGHSLAAVVSYPELSCTPGADKYNVRSGEAIMDWSHGAPPIALVDNTLCPANEKVYEFLDKVLTEVAPLFPFGYIHMGGDECPKNFWEKSDAIKALMTRENLKTMEEVQSYFEKRLEKIVQSKGKKFMGWDEILEGGLAPSAAVMSWRGISGGIAAARLKHDVVMSPTTFAYIDYMQGDAIIEPHIYSTLRLSKAYQFEPVPDSVDAKYILGGQANLWTEQVYNMRHAEYMTWPRGLAISEAVWSPKGSKNWPDFFRRTEKQFARFDEAEINYSPAVYDPIFSQTMAADSTLQITLSTEALGLQIHYSFDNSFPDNFYPVYNSTLAAPKDAVMLRVITYKGKQKVGRMISMPLNELRKRASRKNRDV